MLSGGDRRSPGNASDVAELAEADLNTRMELVRILDTTDALVRMRAADALEKVSARAPGLLQPFTRRLVDMATREKQQEVRWHLAQILPRLDLNAAQRESAVAAMREYRSDGSSIVRTWSMNAIWEFAKQDGRYASLAREVLAEVLESGSAAEKARVNAIVAERGRLGEAGP
jgi:hypothetical protein